MSTTEILKQSISNLKEPKPLIDIVREATKEVAKSLPNHMKPERVIRIAVNCIQANPEISKCTPQSFIGSLFAMAALGLEPVGGRCYLLPFKNKRKFIINGKEEWKTISEINLIVGYKGYIDLFYRHEAALSIDAQEVCKNDVFEVEFGTRPYLKHIPKFGDRGEILGYYAVARLKGDAPVFRYMTREECLEHGKSHSKTFDNTNNQFYSSSPWAKEPEAMCKKTVLLQLSKLLPLSIEIQRAIDADETSRDYRDGAQDALMLPNTTEWHEESAKIETPVPGGLT